MKDTAFQQYANIIKQEKYEDGVLCLMNINGRTLSESPSHTYHIQSFIIGTQPESFYLTLKH